MTDVEVKTLSTGQVSGQLHMTVKVMQRYVKEYRKYFSELARQSNRGRRWTPADVQTLLTIRNLKQQRKSPVEISTYLEGQKFAELPIPASFDVFSAMTFCQDALQETDKDLLEMRKLVKRIEGQKNDYQILRSRYDQLFYEFNILKFELLRLKLIYRRPRKLPPPKKYDSVWRQFQRYVWTGIGIELKAEEVDPIEKQCEEVRKAREIYLPDYGEFKDNFS